MPLMVRGPGVPAGAVRKQLVINNDLAPTIAELAGASTPSFVDGRSFAPLLSSSPPSSWRTAFLEEGYPTRRWISRSALPHKSVHTQQYMFTEYETGERELYDSSTTPTSYRANPERATSNSTPPWKAASTPLEPAPEMLAAAPSGVLTAPTPRQGNKHLPAANATGVAPQPTSQRPSLKP